MKHVPATRVGKNTNTHTGERARHGCEFDHFFAAGVTPKELLDRGVYSSIATSLKGGLYRTASMVILAQAVLGESALVAEGDEAGAKAVVYTPHFSVQDAGSGFASLRTAEHLVQHPDYLDPIY